LAAFYNSLSYNELGGFPSAGFKKSRPDVLVFAEYGDGERLIPEKDPPARIIRGGFNPSGSRFIRDKPSFSPGI
jgi:hypothetical protein